MSRMIKQDKLIQDFKNGFPLMMIECIGNIL